MKRIKEVEDKIQKIKNRRFDISFDPDIEIPKLARLQTELNTLYFARAHFLRMLCDGKSLRELRAELKQEET